MTVIGAVVVFFVGIHRFHVEQEHLIDARIEAEQLARDREFRRELWLRELDTLSTVAKVASRIAATVEVDQRAFDVAVQDYEALYWGRVTLIDNNDLTLVMDELRNEIRYHREGLEPADGTTKGDAIKQRAYAVAVACKNAIENSRGSLLGFD